jgi:hypothetical protein
LDETLVGNQDFTRPRMKFFTATIAGKLRRMRFPAMPRILWDFAGLTHDELV